MPSASDNPVVMLLFTAVPNYMQLAEFWSPLAWPDLLCAYKSRTRQQAQAHVVIAMVLAFICWHPRIIAADISAVAWAWTRLNRYSWSMDGHMMILMNSVVPAVVCIHEFMIR